MRKPTPEKVQQLRDAMPEGAPRVDYREMTLSIRAREDGEAEPQDELIRVAISSEAPVLRYDFWKDEQYYEVLDHGEKSVDLSYARDGLPFISSHRAWNADDQHGIAENVRIEKKRLVADIRMSKAARSQEIAADLKDGIRKKVSVGYLLSDEYEVTDDKRGGIPTRRYKNWLPIEVSTVPVPADYDVGIERARSLAGHEAYARFLTTQPTEALKAEERTMSDQDKAPAGAAPVVQVNEREIMDRAANRVEQISQLATSHKCEDKLSEWIRSGKSAGEVSQEINRILADRLRTVETVNTSRGVELNEKDYRKFSYARALLADSDMHKVATESGVKVDVGFEREVAQEARKQTPFVQGRGIFIPYVTTRANVDSTVSTTGAPFKFTQPGDFIDLLRNAASVTRAGATMLTGLTGPVSFPKQTGAATASWVAENPGSDMSRTNLTTSTVSLAFKTVQAAAAVSRQALFSAASGNYDLEQIIRSDLAKVIALAIDLGALNGSGSSNQPTGLLQDTSVGTATALGTNAGTMAWANIVDLEYVPSNANAVGSRWAYMTNAKQRKVGRLIAPLGATNFGVPVWQSSPQFPDAGAGPAPGADGTVNGYSAYVSNQVPSNLTKGTSTTICSAWIFGAFEHLMIGQFGAGFEVLVDPYTLKLQNLVDLTAWNFVDVANRYPVAFATIKDAL